jgi:hypothetical protein
MKAKILVLISILALVSCKKEKETIAGPQGPQGTQGPAGASTVPTGTISGFVVHQNLNGYNYQSNSGVVVTIKGTGLKGTSDDKGNFKITGVPTGVYTLEYKHSNTNTWPQQNINFAGNGTYYVPSFNIIDAPTWTLSNVSVDNTSYYAGGYTLVNVTVTPNAGANNFIVIFGKTASLDNFEPDTYDYSFQGYINTNSYPYSSGSLSINSQGFYPSGTKYYVKVYPLASIYGNYSTYIDMETRKTVYATTGVAFPQVFELTMP